MPLLCQEVPYGLQKLTARRERIKADLAKVYHPNTMAYLRLKLSNIDQEIRAYKRRN